MTLWETTKSTPAPWCPYPAELLPQLKRLFAAATLRHPDNPYAAANEIETDHGKCMWITSQWLVDSVVLAERDRLQLLQGPISRVPTKEQFALEVYTAGKDARTVSEKMTAFRFFAELMDYVPQKGAGQGVNVNINNNNALGMRIMAVPVAASDEEWERRAAAHSEMLLTKHG